MIDLSMTGEAYDGERALMLTVIEQGRRAGADDDEALARYILAHGCRCYPVQPGTAVFAVEDYDYRYKKTKRRVRVCIREFSKAQEDEMSERWGKDFFLTRQEAEREAERRRRK